MEVVAGIYQIKGVANVYLVVDDDIMLIDTGLPGSSSKIIKYVKENLKRNPQDIKTIVITHHHFDHTGSLDKLKILSGAQVAAHSADAPYISENKKPVEMGFMRYMVNLIKFIYRTKPVEIDILLNDGDVINGYQVIQTPGHTPGSICLYNPQNKVLIVGDNLGYSKDKIVSPPANLLPEPEKYKKSMKKLENLDVEVILSGHSPPVTNEATSKLDEYLKDIN